MIVFERPPNFDRILAAFPNADKPGVIFAFGGKIYNPSGGRIPGALIAHECTHLDRQKKFLRPDDWWAQYITDQEFRYNEELLAHVAEFKAQCGGLDRNYRAKLLNATATRLIAPLYNYVPPRTLQQACKDIKELL